MEAKLKKCRNSNEIRLPNSFLKIKNIKDNDKVDLNFNGEKTIITKLKEKNH